ncbi:hypothetical protein AYI68_g3413 [Smittium mucronatum]|uniref:Uncharacterized protein n=1 Tax=Smittium mucronatum TaxID=133383 RepID=A0A1R0GZZ0_9FUNG|nr:hypothetical protein AYI68_g3413 [Smittium mucronatum]
MLSQHSRFFRLVSPHLEVYWLDICECQSMGANVGRKSTALAAKIRVFHLVAFEPDFIMLKVSKKNFLAEPNFY